MEVLALFNVDKNVNDRQSLVRTLSLSLTFLSTSINLRDAWKSKFVRERE